MKRRESFHPTTDDAMSRTPFEIELLMVSIHNNSNISCSSEKYALTLNSDPSSRHWPLLEAQMEQYKSHLGNPEPLVQIRVENNVNQQRVMDVLNAMLAKEIIQVTFLDQQ